jgi:hypothetical protein
MFSRLIQFFWSPEEKHKLILPNDCLFYIFEFLSPEDGIKYSYTCKVLRYHLLKWYMIHGPTRQLYHDLLDFTHERNLTKICQKAQVAERMLWVSDVLIVVRSCNIGVIAGIALNSICAIVHKKLEEKLRLFSILVLIGCIVWEIEYPENSFFDKSFYSRKRLCQKIENNRSSEYVNEIHRSIEIHDRYSAPLRWMKHVKSRN